MAERTQLGDRAPRREAPRTLERGAEMAILACVLLWLAMALRHPPWWGLMDDHHHLLVDVPAIAQQGLARFVRDFVARDVTAWGAVRLFYPLQIALLYSPRSPWLATVVNMGAVVLVTWLLFWTCARALARLVPRHATTRPRLVADLGTLSCLAFPWYHDFLLQPSLQEKAVLAWIALTCAALGSPRVQALRPLPRTLLDGALVLGGLALKGQFAIALPLLVGLQLAADLARGSWRGAWRSLVLLAWGLCGVVAIKAVALHGAYTSRYTLLQGWRNLSQPAALLVAAAALVLLLHSLHRWRRDRDRPALVVDVALASCLLAYLLVLAPVGWRYYVIAFAAPWLALPWGLWWTARPRRAVKVLLVVTTALALLVTGHRSNRVLASKQDLRRIVESPLMAELSARGEALRVPCEEGSVAMRHYLAVAQRTPPVVLGPETPWDPSTATSVWFHDAYMCPLPQVVSELATRTRQALIAPSFAGSYAVERYGPASAP